MDLPNVPVEGTFYDFFAPDEANLMFAMRAGESKIFLGDVDTPLTVCCEIDGEPRRVEMDECSGTPVEGSLCPGTGP